MLVTYDGSILHVYVDEERNSHSLKLSPGVILFSSLFRFFEYSMMGNKIMHYVYYALIFIPLGVLMTLRVKIMKVRFFNKIFLICIGILVLSLILEGTLMIVSGKLVSLENLLISILFMASPMFMSKYVAPYCLFRKKLICLKTSYSRSF